MNLGKKLAKNFKDYNGDETSEWMAHYLAEKITTIEKAHGKAKVLAQKKCFEVILLLWEYQAYFPNEMGPFSDFEPVFRAISYLDPDKDTPLYYRNGNANKEVPHEIQEYVGLIKNMDAASRVIISFFIREAMLNTTNESALRWLDSIQGVVHSDEARVILSILPELNVENIDEVSVQKDKRKNILSENIDRLKAFERTSKSIRLILKEELDELDKDRIKD